jgi:predicted O-methyltransferase YrrM
MAVDRQGWHSDHEIFKKLLMDTMPEVIIEVGSWKGASAIGMLTKADQIAEEQELDFKPHLFCVDTWLGSPEIWRVPEYALANPRRHGYPQVYFQFLSNVRAAGYEGRVTPLPMTSRQGAGVLSDNQVRAKLIYIDGSHDYCDVAEDLKLYWNLLADGGVMFGDDWGFLGVRVAVNEFIHYREMEVQVIDDNYWVLRKRRAK